MPFWTYMLHCRGGVFYTGHTDDLEKRVGEHQSGLTKGFTSAYLPVELVWSQEFVTRDEALTAERQIKGWSRKKKLALIRGDWNGLSNLARSKSGPSTSSGRTDLELAEGALTSILNHAAQAAPEEACGLLLGEGSHITQASPASNIATDKTRHFEIDPLTLIDAHRAERGGGLKLIGYYHSHPGGLARPSATDREMAPGDGRVWAIVGEGTVAFWRDDESGFAQLSYNVIDG